MSYRSILEMFSDEIVEKKSRFIGYLYPIKSEEEAKNLWLRLKKEHHQASHHCYAYRLSRDLVVERYSDDGEPQGTAGMPILEVLRGNNMENIMALVVRYFGGTKLGTGGLARAYTRCTQEVIAKSILVDILKVRPIEVGVSYHLSGKVQHYFMDANIYIERTSYDSDVTYDVLVESEQVERIHQHLVEMSGNQCNLTVKDELIGYKEGNQINRLGR